MRRGLIAAGMALALAPASAALAADVKLGVVIGFTGPIESLTPAMAKGAELAMKEVTDSKALLGGAKVVSVRGDSTCGDTAAGTAATERVVTSDKVNAIVGGDCSGVTIAMLKNVARPNGIVMISPSATSPALSTIEDDGLFFRTAPSDARQGEVLAEVLMERGVSEIAVTYTNNDYGKGLSDSFQQAFQAMGGTVAASVPHEDGKADYAAEVAALSASGADRLAVFGYVDQGGKGVIQAAVDTGAFASFVLADGMIGETLIEAIGPDLDGAVATLPGSDSPQAQSFVALAQENGLKGDCPFCAESYDAAALVALAIGAAGSADRQAIRDNIMAVANGPGEEIGPGELARGLELLAAGSAVDYVGATGIVLNDVGETFGSYKELEVQDGAFVTVRIR